jgi:hypothetical protein
VPKALGPPFDRHGADTHFDVAAQGHDQAASRDSALVFKATNDPRQKTRTTDQREQMRTEPSRQPSSFLFVRTPGRTLAHECRVAEAEQPEGARQLRRLGSVPQLVLGPLVERLQVCTPQKGGAA